MPFLKVRLISMALIVSSDCCVAYLHTPQLRMVLPTGDTEDSNIFIRLYLGPPSRRHRAQESSSRK